MNTKIKPMSSFFLSLDYYIRPNCYITRLNLSNMKMVGFRSERIFNGQLTVWHVDCWVWQTSLKIKIITQLNEVLKGYRLDNPLRSKSEWPSWAWSCPTAMLWPFAGLLEWATVQWAAWAVLQCRVSSWTWAISSHHDTHNKSTYITCRLRVDDLVWYLSAVESFIHVTNEESDIIEEILKSKFTDQPDY